MPPNAKHAMKNQNKASSPDAAPSPFLRGIVPPMVTPLLAPDELMGASLLMGGNGGVSAGANLYPSLYVNLYDAAMKEDIASVRHLHEKIMQIKKSIFGVGHHPSSLIKGIKCALNLMRICDDFMAEPFHRFQQNERDRVQEALSMLNLHLIGYTSCQT